MLISWMLSWEICPEEDTGSGPMLPGPAGTVKVTCCRVSWQVRLTCPDRIRSATIRQSISILYGWLQGCQFLGHADALLLTWFRGVCYPRGVCHPRGSQMDCHYLPELSIARCLKPLLLFYPHKDTHFH